ncbi:MAG: ATP-binding cassette domain-containing protein [Ruminococcus sp.]|nr:ATP-binding cassette domain-containing protein [Ruminococcus sp.]
MEKEVIITARHLKKVFGSEESEQVIYSDFDIDIYKGDFTVIMGASGAGKSTLMHSLSGMDKPNVGYRTYYRRCVVIYSDSCCCICSCSSVRIFL